MFKFGLGEQLEDKITGFKGTVMGRTNYFTGCDHYGLCAPTLKDGKPLDWEWFDETRLVRIPNAVKIEPEKRESNFRATSGPEPRAPMV